MGKDPAAPRLFGSLAKGDLPLELLDLLAEEIVAEGAADLGGLRILGDLGGGLLTRDPQAAVDEEIACGLEANAEHDRAGDTGGQKHQSGQNAAKQASFHTR